MPSFAQMLLVSSLLVDTTLAGLQLSQGAGIDSQAHDHAEAMFRSEATALARSVFARLTGEGMPPALAHAAVPRELARQAIQLDGLGAVLLHDFAGRFPAKGLFNVDEFEAAAVGGADETVSEYTEDFGPFVDSAGDVQLILSSDRDEVETDASGNVVTTTMVRCKEGSCKRTTRSSNRTAPSEGPAFGKETRRAASDAIEKDVKEGARRMATQMEDIFHKFGMNGLHRIMDNLFRTVHEFPYGLDFVGGLPIGSVSTSRVTKLVDESEVEETGRCRNSHCVIETREEINGPRKQDIGGMSMEQVARLSAKNNPMTKFAKKAKDV